MEFELLFACRMLERHGWNAAKEGCHIFMMPIQKWIMLFIRG